MFKFVYKIIPIGVCVRLKCGFVVFRGRVACQYEEPTFEQVNGLTFSSDKICLCTISVDQVRSGDK